MRGAARLHDGEGTALINLAASVRYHDGHSNPPEDCMSTKPSPRLPLNTVEGMFEKLKWEESRLRESWNVYDSFNFIVTAHHLYWDWIHEGQASTAEQMARARGIPPDAKVLFQAVTDVSNGSKHWKLDNKGSQKRQVVEEVTDSICAGWDSYFFGDMIHFKFDGYFISMSELSSLVMHYLELIIHGIGQKTLDELSASLKAMKLPPAP